VCSSDLRHYEVTGGEGGAFTYALDLFGRYILYLVAPFPPKVLAQVPRPEGWAAAALAGLAAALLAALAAFLARRGTGPRTVVVPLAFLVAFLLPVLAADSIGGANFAERYLYLPSIGLAWLTGLTAARLRRASMAEGRGAPVSGMTREPRPATPSPGRSAGEAGARGETGRIGSFLVATAAGLVAVFLGGSTVARARIFESDLSLFTVAVAASPGSYIARNNLGMALYGAGRLDEAEREYRAALRLSPRSVAARANLGLVAERRDEAPGNARSAELDRAARLYREALALSPRHALSAFRLSRVERQRGGRESAERSLDRFFAAGGAMSWISWS
jgi:tetratricopeptide (TPR) repeat protein